MWGRGREIRSAWGCGGKARVLPGFSSLGTATSALTPAAPPSATANSLRKLVLETPNALTGMAPLLRGTTQRSPRQDVNGWEG